jgi:hypothetical protein
VASSLISAIDDLRRNFGRITAAEGHKAHEDDGAANAHFALDTTHQSFVPITAF